jgi:hypothetical protein
MQNPIQKTIPVEVSDNSCNSCLDFVSSDSTVDRYGEIIQASGWKLENYQKNPVFQNSHQYGDILFTLGKALITEVRGSPRPSDGRGIKGEGSYLFQRIQFACDINPMAKIAYGLYKGKFLNAVSVGFVPIRWDTPNQSSASLSAQGRGLGEVDQVRAPIRRRYLEQELLEVSAVAIPANPNALALGLKSGAINKSDVQDLGELLRLSLDSSSSSSSSSIPDPNLNFLRALHAALHS